MNKEQKVTSLKLSKKIHDKAKEKGFELSESEYCWAEIWSLRETGKKMKYGGDELESYFTGRIELVKGYYREDPNGKYRCIADAYDIAELGEMLPDYCLSGKADGTYNCWKFTEMCLCNIEHYNTFRTDILAEAMGKMYFYLLDNDLL